MKLTELRDKIDEALKMNDDYEVRIIAKTFMEYHILDIDEASIDRSRFNFDLYIDVENLIQENE